MTRLRHATAAGALVAALLGACGESDEGARPESAETTTTPAGSSVAAAYVGLSRADAIAKADAENRQWRIGREDDEQFALTQDFVDDRVTFEIDDGTVTKATLG